jgi:opacity protein-like surface antigen
MRYAKWVIPVLFLAGLLALNAEALPKTTLRVKVQVANIRESADIKSPIIMTVKMGTVFEAVNKIGPWYEVTVPKPGTSSHGYIHESVVEEMAPAAQPEPVTPPAKIEKPVQRETAPVTTKAEPRQPAPMAGSKEPYKKIFLRLAYQIGFQEESPGLSLNRTVYYEGAQYNLAHNARKGNSIDGAIGFRFSRTIGVALGFSSTSRDMPEKTSFSIPHPLWPNTPRTGEVQASSLRISATDLYLNLMFNLVAWKFGIDIYGGPCYMLTKADIISDIAFSEGNYPYAEVVVSTPAASVKSNVFGFNAGASLGFNLMDSLAIFVDGRYVTGKGKYKSGTDIPNLTLSLGGFKAGAGVKLMF